jgi:hypothetical protein
MANEHYDEFCLASFPELTPLERQLLGHYCTRFNESVMPPRAWPGLQELENITNAHPKSISRALGNLTRKGHLSRVTLASKERGRRAEYAPNREVIRSRIKVTEELPNVPDVTHLRVTGDYSLSNATAPISNPPVASRSPHGYPKPKEPNKPNNVNRFNLLVLSALPERLRTLSPGVNFERLLDECDELGISDEVRLVIATNRWDNVHANPGGIINKLIKDSIERKRLGQAVVALEQVTNLPPRFEPETRVITPKTPETEQLLSELWVKLGRLPK